MDINGCHIVSTINAEAEDGFESTVSRYVGCRLLPTEDIDQLTKVTRGPFMSTTQAIRYAMTWDDAESPPAVPESSKSWFIEHEPFIQGSGEQPAE